MAEFSKDQLPALRSALVALAVEDPEVGKVLGSQFLTDSDLRFLAAALAAPGRTLVDKIMPPSFSAFFKVTKIEDWERLSPAGVAYIQALTVVAGLDGGVDLRSGNVRDALNTLFPDVVASGDFDKVAKRTLTRAEDLFGRDVVVGPEHCGRAFPEKAEPVRSAAVAVQDVAKAAAKAKG
jgi:hypothetical protein